MLKVKSAHGVKGMLLPQMGGELIFRVYAADHTFVDYTLRHSDLCVTIRDEDAFFYEKEGSPAVLDHSPATLGITVDVQD